MEKEDSWSIYGEGEGESANDHAESIYCIIFLIWPIESNDFTISCTTAIALDAFYVQNTSQLSVIFKCNSIIHGKHTTFELLLTAFATPSKYSGLKIEYLF